MINIKPAFIHKHSIPVIPAVDKYLISEELTRDKFVKYTNSGNNEIYIISAHDSPNVMREIGRLREISFRDSGGGTGKELDIDEHDTAEHPFLQIIVWNPKEKDIIGGYRYIQGNEMMPGENGLPISPTAELFDFSQKFIDEYLPYSIEFGRSFVQPMYQPGNNLRRGMFSLDNIWDGIGHMLNNNPDIRYLYGKMTMYPHYNKKARNLILCFLNKFFADRDKLLSPKKNIDISVKSKRHGKVFKAETYEENYKILLHEVRKHNETVPPLFNAYMNLSASLKCSGTALNRHFGEVEETAILLTVSDIYEIKKDRYFSASQKS